jgi:phosphatidylglycerol lysyltransferase
MSMSTNPAARDPLATALKNSQLFVKLASLFTFVTGVLLTLMPLLRHSSASERLERIVLPPNIELANSISLLTGIALTYLAYELLQRKRSAWLIALGASIGSVISQAYLVVPTIHTLFLLLVISTLLIGHDEFVVKAPAAHIRQGIKLLIGSVLFALMYGTVGFWLLDKRDFGTTFSIVESFENTLRQYSLIGDTGLIPHTRYALWFLNSFTVVGAITLVYSLYNILRPLSFELREAPIERAQARELLDKYGGDIDDYFKLWPQDKSFFFSSDNEAFVAYGVARGVAVCFANPEGRPGSIRPLMQEFKEYCFNNGWIIAFVAASDKYKTLFDELGYSRITIGADAVINIDTFLNETVRNKYFRNIVNRFTKADFTTERYMPPHDGHLIIELKDVSNDWLKVPGRKEWSFITGRFSPQYFQETPLFVLRDEHKRAIAFANELPRFKAGDATIDLMRHRRDIPKNAMDFLFIELMRRLQEEGIERFNLGLSPLAREHFSDSASQRLMDFFYRATQAFISTKGLHQYKSKFEPVWEPRYVYFTGNTASLPKVGLALSKLSIQKHTNLR